MPRGGVVKPTALKLLEGTYRADRARNEPIARQSTPEPPEHWPPRTREVWDRTVRELSGMNLLAASDREMLVCFCEAVVARDDASRLLAKGSMLTKDGEIVRNPAYLVWRQSCELVAKFGAEFGLSPAARTRISVDPVTPAGLDDNPFMPPVTG